MQKAKGIDELTGLRFFAAFHVLLFHHFFLLGKAGDSVPQFLKNIVSFGDSAVSFFFVLSGFILTYVYVNEQNELKTNKKNFYIARFSRIYPIYLLAFLIDLPRGLGYFFEKYDLSTAIQKILISAGAYLSMVQSWHPRLTPVWNSPGWSLSTEMFFYLLFPFIAPIVFKKNKEKIWIFLLYTIPIILYVLLNKVFALDLESGEMATLWRSLPILRLTEFAIGIYLGKMYLKKSSLVRWLQKDSFISSYLFWGILMASLFVIGADLSFPRGILANFYLLPLFSWMILILACTKVSGTSLLRNKLVILLGSASYALYVIHVPILYYVQKLLVNWNYGITYFCIYCFVTVMLSIFLFKKLEMPMQKYLRGKFG